MSSLDDFARLSGKLYVDGDWVASKSTAHFDVIDPATEESLGRIADATDAEVDQAIDIANKARKAWWRQDSRTRAVTLHDIAATIRRDKALYAEALTREEGKPFKEAVDEVSWCATAIDYYAELARHETGRVAGTTVPGQFHFAVKEPLGTVVIILPFNYPLVLLCWEAAAALAAGNAVIVKPHEQTSLTTLKFMELFAALPAGLMQVVTGGPRVGQRLIASNGTHARRLYRLGRDRPAGGTDLRRQLKPCLIEASGNDPMIIMPSAPLDMAARGRGLRGLFQLRPGLHLGRTFLCARRHSRRVRGTAGGRSEEAADRQWIWDRSIMGPLATHSQRDRFEGMIARARQEGAKVRDRRRPSRQGLNRGWFVEPTVLTDVTPDMEILNEEPFGPVAPICRVESFDEAIDPRQPLALRARRQPLHARHGRGVPRGERDRIRHPLDQRAAARQRRPALRRPQALRHRTAARAGRPEPVPEHQVRDDRPARRRTRTSGGSPMRKRKMFQRPTPTQRQSRRKARIADQTGRGNMANQRNSGGTRAAHPSCSRIRRTRVRISTASAGSG